jgi:tartrate-resistant acid phosphatase type 5
MTNMASASIVGSRAMNLHLLLLLSCNPSESATSAIEPDVAVSDADSPAGADSDADTDGDSDGDTDVVDSDSDAPDPVEVRFIAMGDGGEGNPDQYLVADVVKDVCDVQGCDFALYLGDNFYDDGVDSVTDSQFEHKFELPYADLSFPFWVVLGNHDYGAIPAQFWKAEYEIEYTQHSTKWTLPDAYYSHAEGHIDFFALDTNAVMFGAVWANGQQAWFDAEVAASVADWKIAYGHHPYLSNGQHGNAGDYEGLRTGIPAADALTALPRGQWVKDFFDESVCGEIDVYLCGHDHNRQLLEMIPSCPTAFAVAGAAAKTSGFEYHKGGNDVLWEDDTTEGFFWFEIIGNELKVQAWNKAGAMDYEVSWTK